MASSSRLLAPLGWVLSAASLLNLVQDLSRNSIEGKLADWLGAYNRLAKVFGNIAFGWLDWRWMSITTTEVHVLILAAVLCATMSRSWLVNELEPSTRLKRINAMGAWSVWLLTFVLCAALPDAAGWAVGAIAAATWLALAALVTFMGCNLTERGIYPPCKVARREALGVLACAVVLLIAGQLATQFTG